MKLLVAMPIILVAVLASDSEAKKFKKVKREVIYEEIPVGQQQNPSRKFHLKPVQTPYQQCKMECKRQRDAVEAQEYLLMLREELAATEAQVEADAKSQTEPLLQQTAQVEKAPPKQLHTAKEGNPSVQVKDVIRETARDAVLQ